MRWSEIIWEYLRVYKRILEDLRGYERNSALQWRRREREVCVNTDSVFVLLLWTPESAEQHKAKTILGRVSRLRWAAGKPLARPKQNQQPNSSRDSGSVLNVCVYYSSLNWEAKTFDPCNNSVVVTLRFFAELPPTLKHICHCNNPAVSALASDWSTALLSHDATGLHSYVQE